MIVPVAAASSALAALRNSLYTAHYAVAIDQYAKLSEVERRAPEASYIVGYSLFARNQFDQAKPYLEAAQKGGYEGFGGTWPSASVLLQRINYLQVSKPPFAGEYRCGESVSVRVFGRSTPWTQAVFSAMPRFIERGQAIFGKDLPAITFYFFDNYADFGNFFQSIFSQSVAYEWQDATGNSNVVVFCETGKGGKVIRPAGSNAVLMGVLHEYGHAICTTYFGDSYLQKVPNWLNEGMADAIALPYLQPSIESAERRLRRRAQTQGPLTYGALCNGLYDDPQSGYSFARLMCLELLKDKDPTIIKTYLTQARTVGFEEAVKSTFGLSGQEVYSRVTRRFWSNF